MMIRRLPCLVATLGFVASTRAWAQQPVTRDEAVAAALARGPLVALAAADTASARAGLVTAREFLNPIVSASYTKDVPQYHATLDVPLDFPWIRTARIGAAAASLVITMFPVSIYLKGFMMYAAAAVMTARWHLSR